MGIEPLEVPDVPAYVAEVPEGAPAPGARHGGGIGDEFGHVAGATRSTPPAR